MEKLRKCLVYVQQRGFFYSDLKLDNVMYKNNGDIILLGDLGSMIPITHEHDKYYICTYPPPGASTDGTILERLITKNKNMETNTIVKSTMSYLIGICLLDFFTTGYVQYFRHQWLTKESLDIDQRAGKVTMTWDEMEVERTNIRNWFTSEWLNNILNMCVFADGIVFLSGNSDERLDLTNAFTLSGWSSDMEGVCALNKNIKLRF
jgi:hypothetical protein